MGIFNITIHLLVINNLEYHRDELLYFSLGQHPDFGYATVPPIIGWVAAFIQNIFGYSLFAVKLVPALLSGILVWLSSRIAKELGGSSYAQVLTAIAIIVTPFSLRSFHLFQPVSIDIIFWSLILYLAIRYVNTQKNKYLISLGFISGFALLNKYLVLLLIAGLLISLLMTYHRIVFRKKALYLAIVFSILIFLPNLIWQVVNDFPVIGHMQALNERQLVHVDRIAFLFDQITMTLASSLLMILGLFFLLKSKMYRFLGFTILFVLSILILLQGKSYYTLGILPILIAAGAVLVERVIQNKIFRWLIPIVMVFITIPILPLGLPVYQQDEMVSFFKDLEDDFGLTLGRDFEDGTTHSLPQDYADQLGWEELTQIANQAYQKIPEKQKSIIYCENYGQAGAIAVIGKKYKLPEPKSFNESFVYWSNHTFDPDIEYFIYINDELGQDVADLFLDIELVGGVSNIHAIEYGTQVYLCSNPKTSFNEFWKRVLDRVDGNPF